MQIAPINVKGLEGIYYKVTTYGNTQAEFCEEGGNVKIIIYNVELKYMRPKLFSGNVPSQCELDLFYKFEEDMFYVPLVFNGRLL